jgi:outer membrane protein TolC
MSRKPLHPWLLLFTLLVAPPPAAAAGGIADLSFLAAWERLAATSDALAAATSALDQARSKREAARDLYLPEVEASASYTHLDTEVTLSPNDLLASTAGGDRLAPLLDATAHSYGLTTASLDAALTSTIAERDQRLVSLHARWPLYAGGRIDAAQDIAAAVEKEAVETREAVRRDQFVTLVDLYFGTALSVETLEIKKASAVNLARHVDHAARLHEQGQIARVERLRAEVARDKAQVEWRKAERDLEIASLALGRLLKSDTPLFPNETAGIDRPLPPLPTLLVGTVDHGPAMAMVKAKQEQAVAVAVIEKGKYLPSVALFGTYNLFEEEDLVGKTMPDWLVGVGFKMAIIDRSGRGGHLQAATSALQRLQHLQEQARTDLSLMVEKNYRLAAQAEEEYQGLASSLRLAEETVALRHRAFSQGLATSLDVVDAELLLAGVKTQRSAAAHGFITHLARLHAGAGLIDTFVTIPEQHEAR